MQQESVHLSELHQEQGLQEAHLQQLTEPVGESERQKVQQSPRLPLSCQHSASQ